MNLKFPYKTTCCFLFNSNICVKFMLHSNVFDFKLNQIKSKQSVKSHLKRFYLIFWPLKLSVSVCHIFTKSNSLLWFQIVFAHIFCSLNKKSNIESFPFDKHCSPSKCSITLFHGLRKLFWRKKKNHSHMCFKTEH